MTNTIYTIQDKETKEPFKARSGKGSWNKPNHAKTAFYQSEHIYFDEQEKYKIVELKSETLTQLEEAVQLLKYVQGRADYDVNLKIQDFLSTLKTDTDETNESN